MFARRRFLPFFLAYTRITISPETHTICGQSVLNICRVAIGKGEARGIPLYTNLLATPLMIEVLKGQMSLLSSSSGTTPPFRVFSVTYSILRRMLGYTDD